LQNEYLNLKLERYMQNVQTANPTNEASVMTVDKKPVKFTTPGRLSRAVVES